MRARPEWPRNVARNRPGRKSGRRAAHGKRERDASEEKLRKRLRGLIDELTQLLDPLDSRWLSFGLKCPGAPESPDAVQNTRATALGGGQVRVQCDPAPRADYYQVWIQVVGVDGDFRLAAAPPPSVDALAVWRR